MTSSDEDHFQSAQRSEDQIYADDGGLDSSSADSSDILDHEDDVPVWTVPRLSETSDLTKVSGSSNAVRDPDEGGPSAEEDLPARNLSPSRPNKYRGHPSTWRNWTAPERDLAASLNKLTANDLSIHLYNSSMLKKMQLIQNQLHTDEAGYHDSVAWTPPRSWTAWPLPPGDVPREEEGKRWEDLATVPKSTAVSARRSTEVLRELLVAQILRKARNRFNDRESESPPSEASESSSSELQSEVPIEEGEINEASESEVQQSRASQTGSEKGQTKIPAGEADDGDIRPVVMTDDDRADHILNPTVKHVISRIDDILIGLHHARNSYMKLDDTASDPEIQVNERPTIRRGAGKRKRSALTLYTAPAMSSDEASAFSENENPSTAIKSRRAKSQGTRSKSRSRMARSRSLQNRKSRTGCRDWSDVLGIASMTGWPSSVIERTAARCAALFEEAITFRTLEEGNAAYDERTHLPDNLEALAVSKSRRAMASSWVRGTDSEGGAMFGGVHIDGFLQPIEGKKSWKYSNKKAKVSSGSGTSDS